MRSPVSPKRLTPGLAGVSGGTVALHHSHWDFACVIWRVYALIARALPSLDAWLKLVRDTRGAPKYRLCSYNSNRRT